MSGPSIEQSRVFLAEPAHCILSRVTVELRMISFPLVLLRVFLTGWDQNEPATLKQLGIEGNGI